MQASVTAIESRDPTTSGHSFRVADLTVALAAAVDRADSGPFRDVRFSADEMREIRYASLLHDFGKVGVREEVLVKAKKLYPAQLELIRQRVEIIRRGLELRHARREARVAAPARPRRLRRPPRAMGRRAGRGARRARRAPQGGRRRQRAHRDAATAVSARIRRPGRARRIADHPGDSLTLITPDEARILAIPRGSLTAEEYDADPVATSCTPTSSSSRSRGRKELRRVPEIARSHHEKLNGGRLPGRLARRRTSRSRRA